ncbi:PTS sugar transporter subunit IIA [Oceanivirga salmonicida]|uniref:PTS sugar transporter subunit IIA n=1 Tax=Oceanivirga salmonicida TaxID=1769291 RepID=UPI0012E165D4|nr:PTS sugar transporter subunit IIA [Oceanivirga salmonicida]
MFERDNIYLDFEIKNKKELFEKMTTIFEEKNYIKNGYLESILNREKNYPTGLSFGEYNIAIPHTYYEFVKEEKIIFIRLKNPIDFVEMGTENNELKVKVIVMLLVNRGENQAEILSYLMDKLGNKENYDILEKTNDKNMIYKILKK